MAELGLDVQRWFLSYNSQDLALMEGLDAALRRKEPDAKVFFAPASLRAGGIWLPELAKAIGEANAFVLLVGEKGLGPWQVIEYYEALDRRVKEHNFPVVLVLLDGQPAPGLPFLRQLHWIVSADPSSEQCIGQVLDVAAGGGARPSELWRYTAPYRGLAAMEEKDSDYFFGRGGKTIEVIKALEAAPNKLPVLLGNSGVGKSSVAQAGVLAAIRRQGWSESAKDAGAWPQVFQTSRSWCVLSLKPGTEPVRALVEPFIRLWAFDPTDPRRDMRLNEWTESLIEGHGTLRGLLNATEDRFQEQGRSRPPAFMLYIDQGEELYVRAEPRQRRRFSQMLAEAIADPRLHALMSLRADFLGELQKDEALDGVSLRIEVKPLREAQLLEVVSKPAALLSARFENEHLAEDIARRAAEESSQDAGALPLLSYLLDDMWKSKDPKWDGTLRLPAAAVELGRALVDRANAFVASHPEGQDRLRRILTLKLANVRQDGEPTRRRASRDEFTDDEWRLAAELADHPYRLLAISAAEPEAAAAPAPEGTAAKAGAETPAAETFIEVAHEAIFRRWDKLREWVAAEREFLAWRSGLEAASRAWQAAPEKAKKKALLLGFALRQARQWLGKRGEDISKIDRTFIAKSANADLLRKALLAGTAACVLIAALAAWVEHDELKAEWRWYSVTQPFMDAQIKPFVLTAEKERALKPEPNNPFRECASEADRDYCPQMIVLPAGAFLMGAPSSQSGGDDALPQHTVTIAKPFAVSRYTVTFDEWDACVAYGDCPRANDSGWGRGRQPVINVTWDEAHIYVAWLSKMTGKTYRLLSEAEYEYAAEEGGKQKLYPWGDDLGTNNADCNGCGSRLDGKRPAPVGSFAANSFGLFDMVGNVWEWIEDCYHPDYNGAPTDGSAWQEADCHRHIDRGGSWYRAPGDLRVTHRDATTTDDRYDDLRFRVARMLSD
jgi:formylglycine-generating enzyme required for sulfatase activity